MDDAVSPAVPTTTGALLAEEWTINPFATLPSFLEMFMMEEAARSAGKSLDTGMELLQRKLEVYGQRQQTHEVPSAMSLLRQSYATVASQIAKWLHKFHPEIRCLILYTLERQCLRSDACATIAESLYGGRRTKLEQPSSAGQRKLLPLTDRDKTRLALLVALVPYLQHRLLLLYQRWKQGAETTIHDTTSTKLRKFFVQIFPWVHISLSSLDVAYKWRYLIGKSLFFYPTSQLLGLMVRRVTQEDSPSSTTTTITANDTKSSSSDGGGDSASTTLQPNADKSSESFEQPITSAAAAASLRRGALWVLSSAVVLSWISHFRSELRRQRHEHSLIEQQQQQQQPEAVSSTLNHRPRANNGHLSYPPPPASGIANSITALPRHLCPICRQPRVHPTAVATSGFVFCLKCLSKHVQATGTCPITGRKCTEGDMLRLYEPNHQQSTPVPVAGTETSIKS